MNRKSSDLAGLRNLGPTIIRRLAQVGIREFYNAGEDKIVFRKALTISEIPCEKLGGRALPPPPARTTLGSATRARSKRRLNFSSAPPMHWLNEPPRWQAQGERWQFA